MTYHSRDWQAVTALRTRVGAIVGLWPIHWANSASAVPLTDGYLAETPLGGATIIAELGPDNPVRHFTRQWALDLFVPAASDLEYLGQFGLIEAALRAAPVTIAEDEPSGPITLMVTDVQLGPLQPETSGFRTATVLVAYAFLAATPPVPPT